MLEVSNLCRTFGTIRAVDDVSFTVPDGSTIGFVGGNGAGKTTTMRMIMGLLAPDSGAVLWDGEPISTQRRRSIGYMPEERGLYPKQPILDQLVYLAKLKGASAKDATTEAMAILERLGLADRTKDKLEKLSLGNQQRVQIAASLLAHPTMLILDEPFSGLDPAAVDAMAAMLKERSATGVPVLFSSHQLDLVERLCDGLVILSKGKLAAVGTREELLAKGPVRYRLVLDQDAGFVRDIPGLNVIELDGSTALLDDLDVDLRQVVLAEAMKVGRVLEFSAVRATLAEIYREVTVQ